MCMGVTHSTVKHATRNIQAPHAYTFNCGLVCPPSARESPCHLLHNNGQCYSGVLLLEWTNTSNLMVGCFTFPAVCRAGNFQDRS